MFKKNKIKWMTNKDIMLAVLQGPYYALKASLAHWQQLRDATPGELRRALKKGETSTKSIHCACCISVMMSALREHNLLNTILIRTPTTKGIEGAYRILETKEELYGYCLIKDIEHTGKGYRPNLCSCWYCTKPWDDAARAVNKKAKHFSCKKQCNKTIQDFIDMMETRLKWFQNLPEDREEAWYMIEVKK